MAMELVRGRSCGVAAMAASSSRMAAPLAGRPQTVRVARGRRGRSGRARAAGEEVGTEEAEKPSVASPESESSSSSNGNGYTAAATPFPAGRKWTGYVEKDTAGQTNIYAVEPTVYVAESVLSSGEAGSSTEGTSNTAAVAFGFGLAAIASAASVLLTVGKNAPVSLTEAVGYDGPPLSYYVSKFSEAPVIEAAGVVAEDSVAAPELTDGTGVVDEEASA